MTGLTAAVVEDVAEITAASRLRGQVRLPGDKSLSHRTLMLAALASGESHIRGASDGADVRSTAAVLRALGVEVERSAADDRAARPTGQGRVAYRVVSGGHAALVQPTTSLDCGNSGTSLRLLAGILAGVPIRAVLDGDESLRSRPVARIIEPLRAMGAGLEGRRQDSLPPLTVSGRYPLRAIDWTTPVPSAQVKSAILLAALRADGMTAVQETVATRDHTERMLRARGVPVRSSADGHGGARIEIEGGLTVAAMDERVPADPSAAAFWLVAGSIHPDAQLRLPGVGVNPTRRAALDLLRQMGADIEEMLVDAGAAGAAGGTGRDDREPVADLVVRSSTLRAIELSAGETARAIDEIPVLCLAATQARGTTAIRGAGELRVKESDRMAGVVAGLRALGADITIDRDDLLIAGPTPLRGTAVESHRDHRLAMTFAIAGLVADGATHVSGSASAAISDPAFFEQLEAVRA
jgi:3-phosphoshikimate 1-carboxyvinyltransferase